MNRNDLDQLVFNDLSISSTKIYPDMMSFNMSSNATIVDQQSFLYTTIVYCLTIPVFFLTAAGNGIILITIKYQARLLSSTSNYFILSLALADFFVGVASMPIMIIFTANKQNLTNYQTICDTWMAFDFLCSSASFLTLSAMSIERYKMLTTSYIHIKHSSKLRVILFICLSWLLPFVTWTPVIIIYRISNDEKNTENCSMPANNYIVLTLCILIYHIPLICMVVFYTKLIIHIKKSSSSNLVCNENFSFNNSFHANNNNNKNNKNNDRFNYQNSILIKQNKRSNSNHNNNENQNNEEMNKRRDSFDKYNYSRRRSRTTFTSIIISKLNLILPCCFKYLNKDNIRNLSVSFNNESIQNNNNNNNNNINVKSLNGYNIYVRNNFENSFKMKKKLINQRFKMSQNAQNSEQYIQQNSCKSSAKNSCNNSKIENDLESSNSLITKIRIQNNSLNNFMDYQERDLDVEIILNKSTRFSLISALSRKKDSNIYESSNYQNLRLKRNRKAARMLGLLVAAFLICWLPYSIIYPLTQFFPNLLPDWLVLIIWWLGYLNSTINPFLYVYSNKNIRRSVRILFLKRLWSYLSGKRDNENFRNDSLKNNIIFASNRNGNFTVNKNEKLRIMNNYI